MIEKLISNLCEGRHEMPSQVTGSIFPNTLNPLNLGDMETIVSEKLQGVTSLELYVTGLTVALIEVVKYCLNNKVELTLFHFNREDGSYYPQKVAGWRYICSAAKGGACDGQDCPCFSESKCCDCDEQSQYECGGMGATKEYIVF